MYAITNRVKTVGNAQPSVEKVPVVADPGELGTPPAKSKTAITNILTGTGMVVTALYAAGWFGVFNYSFVPWLLRSQSMPSSAAWNYTKPSRIYMRNLADGAQFAFPAMAETSRHIRSYRWRYSRLFFWPRISLRGSKRHSSSRNRTIQSKYES